MRWRTSFWLLRDWKNKIKYANIPAEEYFSSDRLRLSHMKSQACDESHLLGEHGDVVEVSLTSLFHRQSEEKPAPVFREQRLLTLRTDTLDVSGDALYVQRSLHRSLPDSIMKHTFSVKNSTAYQSLVCLRFTCLESQVSEDSSCFWIEREESKI